MPRTRHQLSGDDENNPKPDTEILSPRLYRLLSRKCSCGCDADAHALAMETARKIVDSEIPTDPFERWCVLRQIIRTFLTTYRFATLFKLHFEDVFCYFTGRGLNPELAEDLTLEAFTRFWLAFPRICACRRKAYMWKIVKSLFCDSLRATRRRKTALTSFASSYQEPTSPDTIDMIAVKEVDPILGEAIESLPRRVQAVVLLYYYKDLSLHEISNKLDIPYGTITSDHHRALEKLRGYLNKCHPGYGPDLLGPDAA